MDAADLRFSRSEVDAITGADTNQTDLIWSLSDGWPIAVTPLARLIQRNTAKGLAELRHDRGLHELFDYLTQEALTALSPTERDVLEAIALIPNPTKIDIERLGLTNNASGTIRALASNIPFLSVAASGELQVHPLLQEALRHQSHQRREPLIRRLAQRRIAEGERLRGAELFAEIGDGEACASTLDASPLFATTPSPQTIDLVLALDRRILNRHPLLWSMSIMMSRGFGIDKQEWLSEAQRFWEGLGPNDDPALRATIFGTLVNALTNVGDFANADRLCNSFEAGLDSDQISIVAPSIAFWRGVRAVISDQATNLDALEAPLAGLLSNDVTRALWGYEIAAKFFRVTGNRARERSTLATCVEIALHTRLPMVIAATSADATFASWFAGEDELSATYLHTLEKHLTVSTSGGCRPLLDVSQGRIEAIDSANAKKKVIVFANVMAYAQADDPALKRRLALQAVIAADQSCRPFERMLARVALMHAFPEREREIAAEFTAIGASVAPARLKADAARLASGETNGTIFETLAGRFKATRRSLGANSRTYSFSLVNGRLELNGEAITLSKREFELLAFLALKRTPATADNIVLNLWDGMPGGYNSLKVYVSRIRKRLGSTIIQWQATGYVITSEVSIDSTACERAISDARHALRADDLERADFGLLSRWIKQIAIGFPTYLRDRQWFAEYLARMQNELVDVMLQLGRQAVREERHELAVRSADCLLELDPCDEFATEIAICGLISLDKHDTARLYYNRYARAVRTMLETEPADRLTALLVKTEDDALNRERLTARSHD